MRNSVVDDIKAPGTAAWSKVINLNFYRHVLTSANSPRRPNDPSSQLIKTNHSSHHVAFVCFRSAGNSLLSESDVTNIPLSRPWQAGADSKLSG
ncbi:hypothetical protein L596_019618 [Steinernema carpocapsae]|uniref:Uncharacterized protein n=1 Tax=Steinernema carpocapsae TaxID=34508 RepID=A0A4U5MR90_STECR|nr:hypothetical protein L596_019618 [Steinernema carpocapsae]